MRVHSSYRLLFTLLILVGLLKPMRLVAQELPFTQRIYNWARYGVIDHQFARGKQVSVTNLLTGTCWVTSVRGEPVLITAAHILAIRPDDVPSEIGSYHFDANKRKHSLLRSTEISPIVGVLAEEVKDVGLLGDNVDCVILRPVRKETVSASKHIPLSSVFVKVGDVVSVSGYPGTAMEQTISTTVTAIALNGRFFALSQPLDAGYSGGVVLNAKKEAVGLVVTTDKKQTMALRISEESLIQAQWRPLPELKKQNY